MTINAVQQNLFEVDKRYHLAHCISSDCKMGAGIALEFQRRFNLRDNLMDKYTKEELNHPACILDGNVFNLITKKMYWHKPTYSSLKRSLYIMRDIAEKNQVKHIAMPKIGCGLDRLSWVKVKEILGDVFVGTDIKILVCFL